MTGTIEDLKMEFTKDVKIPKKLKMKWRDREAQQPKLENSEEAVQVEGIKRKIEYPDSMIKGRDQRVQAKNIKKIKGDTGKEY